MSAQPPPAPTLPTIFFPDKDQVQHTKGRPSTSGGMRRKGRPPSNNVLGLPAGPAVGGRAISMGGQDGGGSVISAVTMRTEYVKGGVGGGGGTDEMVMGFDDGSGGDGGGGYGREVLHTASRGVS